MVETTCISRCFKCFFSKKHTELWWDFNLQGHLLAWTCQNLPPHPQPQPGTFNGDSLQNCSSVVQSKWRDDAQVLREMLGVSSFLPRRLWLDLGSIWWCLCCCDSSKMLWDFGEMVFLCSCLYWREMLRNLERWSLQASISGCYFPVWAGFSWVFSLTSEAWLGFFSLAVVGWKKQKDDPWAKNLGKFLTTIPKPELREFFGGILLPTI